MSFFHAFADELCKLGGSRGLLRLTRQRAAAAKVQDTRRATEFSEAIGKKKFEGELRRAKGAKLDRHVRPKGHVWRHGRWIPASKKRTK
ncbi:MAG: hypothetical protein ACYTBJ_17880 [Planctomycetota bacterium]|jgi:hypothetical protein